MPARFVSALLRVFKAEYRRPFTRAAELMTTFGLVQAGLEHPDAHGAGLALLLDGALSQRAHAMAELPLTTDVGPAGNHHLPACQHHVPLPAT